MKTKGTGNILALYGYRRDRSTDIFVVNPSGEHLTNLTKDADWSDGGPTIESGSRRIAFTRGTGATYNNNLYVIRTDGTHLRQLTDTEGVGEFDPAWSPVGDHVVYTRAKEGGPTGSLQDLYVLDVSSQESRRITKTQSNEGQASWSPDGRSIIFSLERKLNQDIYSISARGKHRRRLTDSPADDFAPNWSPDGRKILFIRRPKNDFASLWTMRYDGTKQRRLTTDVDVQSAVWSPQGRRIALILVRGFRFQVFMMKFDGTNLRRLFRDRRDFVSLDW